MEGKDITFHKILKEFKKPVLVDNRNWREKVPIVDKYFSLIERWRKEYNTFRPHSALGYLPPAPETIEAVQTASTTLHLSVSS